MIQNFIVAIAIFCAVIIGCATPRPVTMKPIPSDGQSLQYDQGRQVFASRKNATGVAIYPLSNIVTPGQPADFYVFIANYSDVSVNFTSDNLKAFCDNNPLFVFSPEQALRYEEQRTEISSSSLFGVTDIAMLAPYMAQYYEKRNRDLQGYSSVLLRDQTIAAHGNHYGIIRVGFPACAECLRICIRIGSDFHEFRFKTGIVQ